jgi:antitoxin ParD1/3/4
MATMNISLPEPMKQWVEAQTADGKYANSSDVVRDLIRREQVKSEKISHWNGLIEEAYASGTSDKTVDEIFDEVRAEVLAETPASRVA